MFLDLTIKRNPALIKAAAELHQSGKIPANTYVIDLDTVLENAGHIVKKSEETGIKVYFMSKHFNRNPLVSAAIVSAGFPGAVAVDVQCAKSLHRYGIPVAHAGHLVQIPMHEIPHVLEMEPEVWTVYSEENATLISQEAVKQGRVQDILLRVRDKKDIIYPNEEGGIWTEDLKETAARISKLKGVRIAGVVTFPGTLVTPEGGRATPNAETAVKSAEILKEMGFPVKQINFPGASSSEMLKVVKKAGGTAAEPGHGIFGTTPWHLIQDLPEKPAMVYVNEISHTFEKKAYCFGGGFYACDTPANRGDDSAFRIGKTWEPYALAGTDKENIFSKKLRVLTGSFFGRTLNATDYYGALEMEKEGQVHSGETMIFGFRAQAFTMRTNTAVIRHGEDGPRLLGVFDRANQLLDEKWYPVKNSEERVKEILEEELVNGNVPFLHI